MEVSQRVGEERGEMERVAGERGWWGRGGERGYGRVRFFPGKAGYSASHE